MNDVFQRVHANLVYGLVVIEIAPTRLVKTTVLWSCNFSAQNSVQSTIRDSLLPTTKSKASIKVNSIKKIPYLLAEASVLKVNGTNLESFKLDRASFRFCLFLSPQNETFFPYGASNWQSGTCLSGIAEYSRRYELTLTVTHYDY